MGTSCVDEGPLPGGVFYSVDGRCRGPGGVVTGIVSDRMARVDAVLGDGHTRRVALPPLARDEGVRLCAAIDALAPDGTDCGLPPLAASESRLLARATATGTLVAGVVSPEVALARVRLDDGSSRAVPAIAEGPFDGRYRGLVRFFELRLPPGRYALDVELVAADGTRLHRSPLEAPLDPPPLTLARLPGGLRLAAGAYRFLGRRNACLQLARNPTPDIDDCLAAVAGLGTVDVRCTPRRGYLVLPLAAGADGVEVRLAGGRRVAARVIRLPRRLRVPGRVALVVLGPGDRPREVRVTGRIRARHLLRLPAAAEQCGYSAPLYIDRLFRA